MRVLVTRPSREAQSWLRALKTAGHHPVALPLIDIVSVPDLRAVHRQWLQIARYHAVMFVSANAVDFFFADKPSSVGPIFSQGELAIRAWTTGPGTARALMRLGAGAASIDTPKSESLQFDSESLWSVVRDQVKAGCNILIVRGEEAQAELTQSAEGSGRDWLAQRICEAGGSVEFLVVYRRQVPSFSPRQQDQVRSSAADGSVWLFSSSQAIANLVRSFPLLSWTQARAVATHPRIAQTARSHGFGVVCESRPTLDDVVASIESMA